tara:strand:- start:4191 stop:4430 length:240 start_codon:yes stop_codon:yes gene_type:complete
MKDIKTFIIGFLSCACLFLIVGAGSDDGEVGRYQLQAVEGKPHTLCDTKTGYLYVLWSDGWRIFEDTKEFSKYKHQKIN